MGAIYGPMYVLATVFGIVSWLSIEPNVVAVLPSYGKTIYTSTSKFRDDVQDLGNEVGKVTTSIKEKFNENKEN